MYILAGVAVDGRDMASLARAASDAKESTGVNRGAGGWEIHAHDIWNIAGPFSGRSTMLGVQQKRAVFSSMVDVIGSPRVGLVPVVVDKRNCKGGSGGAGRYRLDGLPCSGASSACCADPRESTG